MRDHQVTRRPIPVEQSILWKPVHDPHYVLASLQPRDGGRRKVFIRQQVIGRVEAAVRTNGRHAFGLLVGQFYQCPVTAVEYLVVESMAEESSVSDEKGLTARLAQALSERSKEQQPHFRVLPEARGEILGWYRGVPALEFKAPSEITSVHAMLFQQPWQISFAVETPGHGTGGAVFLHDPVDHCWFHAPFYELLDHATKPEEPKRTLLKWPQYMTMDSVTVVKHEPTPVVDLADARTKLPYQRPWLSRPTTKETGGPIRPAPSIADIPVPEVSPSRPLPNPPLAPRMASTPQVPLSKAPDELSAPSTTEATARDGHDTAPAADRPAAQAMHEGLADVPHPSRDRSIHRRVDKPGLKKLSIVDDRDQKIGAPAKGARISDADDTALGDSASRYIDLARSEGFFIAARFDAVQSFWVLNEPYSGLLLTVVTTDAEVLDATLHYNLQTDEAGLSRTPFREHRDVSSKTIYGRESCVEGLRERCRRLRATNALVREWKVTPEISFLTPAEWESIPASSTSADRGASAISGLNKSRVAALPPGIRTQFHFAGGEEAQA